jgi:multiple sugar transport system permease protein
MNRLHRHFRELDQNSRMANKKRHAESMFKYFLFAAFRAILILGISYVILGPLLGIIASSFFSNSDQYSPLVYLIPQSPTLERYELALIRMDYWSVLGSMSVYVISLTAIQLVVCGMAGYGFARFNFPLKKLMFACVILTIVLPPHSIMYPLYTTFADFNPFGLVALVRGDTNLLTTPLPMYIMTALGTGLRSGLYIFIFVQFFRGLPKEIEEAALIDGAGSMRTFAQVMVPNAVPAIVTVTIFSLVWQYNDSFYGRLFQISDRILLSKQLTQLSAVINNTDGINDPPILTLFTNAGVVLMILPLLIMYVCLQKFFVEGVERSGIVG